MTWIIKDGHVKNVDGDGILIDLPPGDALISGLTVSGAKGNGIVIRGAGSHSYNEEVKEISLEDLLDSIEGRIAELPERDQAKAYKIIEDARKEPNTASFKIALKAIYDISVGVAGSTIAAIVQKYMV